MGKLIVRRLFFCHHHFAEAQRLVGLFHASDTPPSVLISGSATGYYGDLGEVVVCSAVQRLSAMGSPARLMTASMSLRW
jgi:NAD dependent epimerase/dehydratase family enzyme